MTLILALIFIVLALGAAAFLCAPLLRRQSSRQGNEKRDIVVYREQLTEVENDIERGLLTKAQAEAVRTEIHRRMLAVEDAELSAVPDVHGPVSRDTRKIFAGTIGVLVPLLAALLYLWLGSPTLSGKPFAGRAGDPEFALASSAEELQSKLEKTPSAEGYKNLADMLSMMKRHTAAVEAYQKAIDLGSNDAVTWSEMGEEVVLANDGAVVQEALDDFYKALKLNPKDARAWFYMGLAHAQINNSKKAVSIWKGLQEDSLPDAPWMGMVKEHIGVYSKEGGFDPASISPSTPSGQSPHGAVSTHEPAGEAAVQEESVPEWAKDSKSRDAMIKSMVEGLAAKLETNHNDVQGWMKLVNAYRVQGEKGKAEKALKKALRFNPKDAELKAFAEGSGGTVAAPVAPASAQAPADAMHSKMKKMSSEERDAMIRSMTDELAAKLKKKPDDVKGWIRLASAYRMMGEGEKAREAIGKAVRLDPKNLDVLMSQAEIQLAVAPHADKLPGDFVATMRKILILAPENVDALYYVGLAEKEAGNFKAARTMWNKAISGLPQGDTARADIQKQIETLPKK